MHRHGYKGRKFGRERDQRNALMRGLSVSLIEHGSIETTLPKAKDLRPKVEKLVSKALKNDLHNRRQIIDALGNKTAAHKLVDHIAPAMKRTSGYLRIEKTTLRRGDNTQLARISFVDDITDTAAKAKVASEEKKAVEKTTAKKPVTPAAKAKTTAPKPKATTTAAKRTGVRGNR